MGNILTVIPIWTPKIKFNQFSHKREIPFSYRYGNYDIYERTHERPEHPVKKSKEIKKISKTNKTRCNQEIKNKSLKQIKPEQIFALVKEIQALYKLDMTQVNSYMVSCLAKGIEALSKKINTLPKKQIHPDMISGLAKGIKVLNSTNPKLIEPDMISGLAKEIEAALHSTNPKLIEPDMISGLAKGIEALIKNDQTKKRDFSSELKTLSKGLLKVINNNHKENNFKNIVTSLYDDLESLNKEINKSTTVEDFYVKPEEGCSNSWLEQMQKDTTAYGKIINENVKYERRSSEIFNFMQGFVVLEIIHDSQKDDLNEEQKANAEKRANQAIEDLDIYKIKLKDKKTFEANKTITIYDIINEYGVKSQKDVGVKNSDIMIYKDKDKDKEFIYIYTHQYNASLADTAKLTYGDQFVYVKEGHTLQIENTDENKKALNNLIKLLKPHCHENSYAILTHLVHRAIERYSGKKKNNSKDNSTSNNIKNEVPIEISNEQLNTAYKNVKALIDSKTLLEEPIKKQTYGEFASLYKQINKLGNVAMDKLNGNNIKELKEAFDSLDNYITSNSLDLCTENKDCLQNLRNNDIFQINNENIPNSITKAENFFSYIADRNFKNHRQTLKSIKQNDMFDDVSNKIDSLSISKKSKDTLKNKFRDYKEKRYYKPEFYSFTLEKLKKILEEIGKKIPPFTLEYSSQGNRYNYNAYELKTELGTLVLDDKGKMTTIIDKQLDK